MKNNNVLRVRNLAQKALFELELKGQLSDGYWENALPRGHYSEWCQCEVEVAAESGAVGRTFWAARDRYAFASKELLDAVKGRMLATVRLGKYLLNYEAAEELRDLFSTEDASWVGMPQHAGEYWDRKRAKIEQLIRDLGISLATVHSVGEDASIYSERQLRGDLKDLSAIVKVTL